MEPDAVAVRQRCWRGKVLRLYDWQHDRAGVMFAVVGDADVEAAGECVEGPGPGVDGCAGAGDGQADAGALPEDVGEGEEFDAQASPLARDELLDGFGGVQVPRTQGSGGVFVQRAMACAEPAALDEHLVPIGAGLGESDLQVDVLGVGGDPEIH